MTQAAQESSNHADFMFLRVDGTRTTQLSMLLNAPAWAKLGLAVPDARLRERAADALAATIVESELGAT